MIPKQTIKQSEAQIENLIEYMKGKIEIRDWHGVCDAANDIRCLESHITGVKQVLSQPFSSLESGVYHVSESAFYTSPVTNPDSEVDMEEWEKSL